MNNIDVLNDIMKPYFEKKAQMENAPIEIKNNVSETKEKLSELKRTRLERKKALQIELEELRVRKTIMLKDFQEKKEIEIEKYITEALNSDSNFYSNYGAMLRKDLERNYDRKLLELEENFRIQEEKLIAEIKELGSKSDEEKETAEELVNLDNKPNYINVDLREMFEIKDDLKRKLFAQRKKLLKRLEELKPEKEAYEKIVSDLNQKQQEFKEIIDNLANFKYEYNEQNQVINSDEWKALYEKRNLLLEEIEKLTEALSEKSEIVHQLNDINKSLEKVEEYIKLLEPTKEEGHAVMMTMTPWEKKEYDRRKGLTTSTSDLPVASHPTIVPKKTSSENSDMITHEDPVVSSYEIEDGKIVVDTKVDLLKAIFNDIIAEVKGIRSLRIDPSNEKLGSDEYYISTKDKDNETFEESGTVSLYSKTEEPMKLPNGEYVYDDDMKEAVDKYYSKNKGQTYVVRSTGKEYRVNFGTIMKFRTSLKHCSAIKLVKDKKISKLDITRILGKPKTEMLFRSNDIGTIYGKSSMPEGDYVNRNELIAKLDNLFTTKSIDWLRNMAGKLRLTKVADKAEELEDDKKPIVK